MAKAKSGEQLRFPSDLAITSADMEYLKITPQKYLKSKATNDNELGPIVVNMPANFTVSNTQNWSNADFGFMNQLTNNLTSLNAAKSLSGTDLVGGTANVAGAIGTDLGSMGELAKNNAGPIAAGVAAQATTALFQIYGTLFGVNPNVTSTSILSKNQGQIINPQSELYYSAPGLRSWALSYEFAPRSKADEESMHAIIKRLKIASSPRRNEENPWLEIPRVFQVEFMRGGGINTRMPKTKPAALVKFDVTPNNGMDFWTSFSSGGPVTYSVGMAFSEVELIYANEHESGGEVGY